MDNQRNLILAVVLSALLLFGWDFAMRTFYPEPETAPIDAASREDAPMQRVDGGDGTTGIDVGDGMERPLNLDAELATADRITIDAPEIAGTLNPVGARIDDIVLKTHRQTVDDDSGPIRLFAPRGTEGQQFARFDWVGEGVETPGAETVWQVTQGETLTDETPVELRWDNGSGQEFVLRFAIDDHYMFTVTQTVLNTGEGSIALRPRGLINRTSDTATASTWNVHSGPIAEGGGEVNFDFDYEDVTEARRVDLQGNTNWLGFTDIYWMSALVADSESASSGFFAPLGGSNFAAVLEYEAVTVPANGSMTRTTQLFAGAKESGLLDAYEDSGISNFGRAIDWGWFGFIAWPMWQVLIFLFGLLGNFGLAIIGLTIIIRAVLFPIAQKQFASMAQLRAVQPKMKALQERHKDDKQKLQQEMAKLYKEEKVNPLGGCLPIFIQIPIFFALYKVLLLAIEMRHQPFTYIRDLSAQDPATILNLFGLLDFTPPSFLAIGILAVLLGFTMWLQFKLNPAAMDPMQQQIFMIMPWVLMFVMAPFAAGLLLYWISNNILTLAQQKYLYSKNPQLREQMLKEKEEKARAAEREKAATDDA
ncbi:membrane protein insertase YidC [Aurantiacibacter gangjinensis]|uniref:Membrane protein insertase YidC n=1 Tax=Aurantiacibacter gangjinensis TaxID=502682 RepID=A0A0G9MKF1_9SPHN|nr:membrane protein insertase YidC [Aurantiacibacter gangjinensis]APE29469.1 Inner membrane protein translocase component YidC, long form [Aurantiacibacter gangjinensis]KLE31152.1 membrane protein insertase YidC [Aurantiacibacter gangjinensis]